MIIRIINFLRGYVSLLLRGQFIERFINICMHRGLFLWDIRKMGKESAQVKMSVRAFKELPPIAKKTRTRVKILEKRGLPVRLAAYKRRSFFFVGLLIAVVFLYGASLFLWSVDIVGCEVVSEAEIKSVLTDLGVRPGAYKKALNAKDIQGHALAKLDGLSWLWVDIHGCRATVRVQEKRAAPEIVPTEPCDIVAGMDGIITEVHATEGQKKVSAGDTVVRGQVLISSVFTSERVGIEARYTHAAGEVYARTWYEKSMVVPLAEEKKNYTGNAHTERALQIGNFTLPLSLEKDIPYAQSERERTTHDLLIFGKYTGITYRTDCYREYEPEQIEISIEDAVKAAEAQLDAQIKESLFDKGAALTEAHTTYVQNADGTLTVTRTAEFKEQIGVQRRVENVL